MNKVIIAGSRDYSNVDRIKEDMNRLWLKIGPYEVVSGMARGVDRTSHDIAVAAGIKVYPFPADWDRHGRSAGYKRNEQMAKNARYLLAFWDGRSRGTKHMIDIATEAGLMVIIIRTDDPGPTHKEA